MLLVLLYRVCEVLLVVDVVVEVAAAAAVAAAALLLAVAMNQVDVVLKQVSRCLGGWLDLKCQVEVLVEVVAVEEVKSSTKT